MRRKQKQFGAMFLAIAVAASSMTFPVSAKAVTEQHAGKSGTLFQKVQSQLSKDTDEKEYKEGEAVVMYYSSITEKSAANTNQIFGSDIKIEETYNFTSAQSASAASSKEAGKALLVSRVSSKKSTTTELIKKLKKQANVRYAEPNYIYKATDTKNNSKYAAYQWALENVGQNNGTPGCDINVKEAWAQKTGTEKVIAVVDTGVDYTHESLSSNIWNNPYTSQLKGQHGYDFINYDDDPMDDNGHGSHCSGIIAGNGTGVSGVNQTAKIMALKFLDEEGSGDLSGAVGAYDYINRAMNLGVDVVAINNSWGGGEGSEIFQTLIEIVGQKGAITVAAAGNEVSNTDLLENEPWNFESDYVIKVAASNENDELANFSNYGKETTDLAAPGADILSSVSYDVYNPSIHVDDAGYSELLDTFEDASELSEYQALETKEGGVKFQIGEGNGFGEKGNNSLVMKVDAEDEDQIYMGYRKISLPKSETSYHASAMVKASADEEDGYCFVVMGLSKISDMKNIQESFVADSFIDYSDGENNRNYWNMMSVDTGKNEYSAEDEYAIWFAVIPFQAGHFTVQLDNIGFSKQDLQPEELGKYAFFNGTSMAAPQVTGAVALISEMKGEMDPKELRDVVAGCVRKADAFEETTISGGVLDLSKAASQSPIIKNITTEKDVTTIEGNFFGTEEGSVSFNGEKVQVKSWEKEKIVVASGKNNNKTVTIQVDTKEQKSTKKTLYLDYNETNVMTLGKEEEFGTSCVSTDGSNLYSLSENGAFHKYDAEEQQWEELHALTLPVIDKEGVVTDEIAFHYDSQLVYAGGKFYTVAEYDAGYYSVRALVSYDLEEGTWEKAAELPKDLADVEASTLAAYKDKLYLLGGYDAKEKKAVGSVYSYELTAEGASFVKEEATIPARFAAKAERVGDQLVLTLGGDGSVMPDDFDEQDMAYATPNNIVFDGTTWKEVEGSSIKTEQPAYYDETDDGMILYATAQTGVYKGGIIYTGLYTQELGNVFTYQADGNKYQALPCSLYSYTDGLEMNGTTVGDKFMLLAGSKTEYIFDDWFEWSKTKDYDFVDFEENAVEYDYTLYAFDVETGFVQVKGDSSKVTGTGYYYPGTAVTVTPNVKKGQYAVSFTVDGKEITGSSYTIADIKEDHEVEAILDNYVTSISFEKSEYNAVVGEPLLLNAIVKKGESQTNSGYGTIDDLDDILNGLSKQSVFNYGEDDFNPDDWSYSDDWWSEDSWIEDNNAGSKVELSWKVDNTKYATIEDGVLVPLKAGIGKSVTVTATAKDGSNVSGSVVVNIAENKVLATKLTLNKNKISLKETGSYQLKASLLPSNVSNKNLVWESAKSTVAMVSSTGEVIARKPGKTTITVRTTDGSDLRATCQVEVMPGKTSKVTASQTTGSITLKWNKVAGASGYTVYRYDAKTKKDVAVYTANSASKVSVKLTKVNGTSGKALSAGTEYTYKIAAFVKDGSSKIYGEKASIKTATKPATVKLTKIQKKSSTKACVSWKKVSGATGYEVYVSTSKKSGYKKAATVKKTSYTQSKLKKGKTYYYKVRAYKTVNGKKIYGAYSSVKQIKMKK